MVPLGSLVRAADFKSVRLGSLQTRLLITRLFGNSGPSVSWWSGAAIPSTAPCCVSSIHTRLVLPSLPCGDLHKLRPPHRCCFNLPSCTLARQSGRWHIPSGHSRRRSSPKLDQTTTSPSIYSYYRRLKLCTDRCFVGGQADEGA